MFTQSAFIKKNTPELREKLEQLGIPVQSIGVSDNEIYTCFYAPRGAAFTDICRPPSNFVDCSENEALFLAIAALRDDSDYMQWFMITRYNEAKEDILCEWRLCKTDQFDINTMPYANIISSHKATVQELIEHFK